MAATVAWRSLFFHLMPGRLMRPGFCSEGAPMRLLLRKLQLFTGLLAAGLVLPALATDLVVDNLDDDGPGSLRQAIELANDSPSPGVIQFEASLNGVLTLLSPLPTITVNLDIVGPGAQQVSISGNQIHQIVGIDADATVMLSGLSLINGSADLGGGAVVNEGTLTISECILSGNESEFGAGGAIDNFAGELVILSSTLTGNIANSGGALANFNGSVEIFDSTISDNLALLGGGIDNAGQLSIVRSTISGNSADLGGGIENAGELNVSNSTLAENFADFDGGGIDNFGGSVSLLHVTIAFNQAADSGSAIWNGNEGAVLSKHSIIAGSDGNDCFSEPGSDWTGLAINLATDAGCEDFLVTTLAELMLGNLADNGGPTWTHALGADSNALDVAEDCTGMDGMTPVSEDQRGVSRPQGEVCDIGAYERIATIDPPPPEDRIFSDRFEQTSD